MKKLLLTLTFVLFSFGANSITIEQLYKNCKPYQNNGFSFENLSQSQASKAVSCFSYLGGMRDRGVANCVILKEVDKKNYIEKIRIKPLSSLIANADVNSNALITSFINFAENNTEKWKQGVWGNVIEFLSDKFPCKID